MPQEDPGGAAVAEGTVMVGAFTEVGAELQPVTGRARLVGRFDVAVDNSGNTSVPVRLNGSDAEQTLQFDFDQAQIDTKPGSAHFAKVRVRPADKLWRGQPKNHPFQLLVEPQTTEPVPPVVLTGNLLQEPILPKWLLKAVLAFLALLLLLFILWKTLLKPSVESAAREVAIEEIAPVSSAVQAIEPAVEEAAAQAQQASEQAAGAEESAAAAEDAAAGGGGGGGGASGLSTVFNETTAPANFRVAVQSAAGASNRVPQAVPPGPGQTFAMTDLILQNPGGDVGRIRVLINDDVILESALENFRDLDFHFVAPYVLSEGQVVSVEVVCDLNQIVPADPCDDAISFSGFATTKTEVPATTAPAG
jgi:hypothetical protein